MKPADRQKRILAIGLLFWIALPTWASSQDKIPPEVIERTAAQGTALVLVGLKVPWQMESSLSEDGLYAQRAAIASIQTDLLSHLEGRKYRIVRRYQEIPGIALRVGVDALKVLERSPAVTNVIADRPAAAAR
jgi:hypothetical protein